MKKGIFSTLARKLKFERNVIARQWKRMHRKLLTLLNNHPGEDVDDVILQQSHFLFDPDHSSRRKGKFKYDRDKLNAAVQALPRKERITVRNAGRVLGVPSTTLHYLLKDRPPPRKEEDATILVRHCSKLKPTLTDANQYHR